MVEIQKYQVLYPFTVFLPFPFVLVVVVAPIVIVLSIPGLLVLLTPV